MNAKEISDATLPTVTPADDDLMILYDVSEGTTGKTPISGIAPKVAENIVPLIEAKINTVIKRGTVIIPSSTPGTSAVNSTVTFNTPFDDANYAIELTRIAYNYFADTHIVYFGKTKNGFSIQEYANNNSQIRPAHEVSWVAIKI